MGESLTQQRRVIDEALRSVKICREGRITWIQIVFKSDGTFKKAPANFVPAAAVIRRARALIGITGLKACVGGLEGVL